MLRLQYNNALNWYNLHHPYGKKSALFLVKKYQTKGEK